MTEVLAPVEATADGEAPGWRRVASAAPAYLPAAIVAIGGWSHRWVDEDAFINFRVLDQIFAGHGPVFNAGERVEAATSPIWIAVLAVGRALFGAFFGIEWIALVAGLIAAVGAFALAGRAAQLAHRDAGGAVVPVGLILIASVAVVWDFATSGLEMGMVWLWLSACWYVLVSVARADAVTGRRRATFAVIIGLAPLVRPELGIMMVCFVVAWFVLARPRRTVVDLAAMFALPVAYEIFRMGYYATIVPNTALAKDAGGLHLSQGWNYATDFVTPYRLWLSATLIVAVVGLRLSSQRDRRVGIATVAMLAAAVLGAVYIVVIGGDYMHGRLLLPAFFALGLPASVAIRDRALSGPAVCTVAGIWALVTVLWFRPPLPPPTFGLGPPQVADWRAISGARIVPIDDALGLNGIEAHAKYERGVRGYFRVADKEPRPSRDPSAFVLTLGSIGVPAYHAGKDVWVIDIGGLAEPLAARTDPVPGRQAGHRKEIDYAWYDARFGVVTDDPAAIAAHRALNCEPVKGLLDAVDGPMSIGRFFSNIWHSVSYTRLRIPGHPEQAAAEFCPPDRRALDER